MVNISAVDLNLLHVLHAVLVEGSATRAAKRLHVTQSAVSNALARLRQTLGDPLLVRNSRGLSATPRARELEPELAAIMASVGRLLNPRAGFEPATTTREFTVACADYCTAILGAGLAALMHLHAPLATLRLVTLEQLQGAEGLASNIDLHLGMPPRVPRVAAGARCFKIASSAWYRGIPSASARPSGSACKSICKRRTFGSAC